MPGLTIWKNQEIDKLRRDMDRLFARLRDDFGMPLFPKIGRDVPSIDLSETEGDIVIKAEIPGINPEDLDISIAGDILNIKGEMKKESVQRYQYLLMVEIFQVMLKRDVWVVSCSMVQSWLI